jgi:hypothetical protein
MLADQEASVELSVTVKSIGVAEVRVTQPETGLRFVTKVEPEEFLNLTSR